MSACIEIFLQGSDCMNAKSLRSCLTLFDPMDSIAHQAPLSMGFSRQEYWSELLRPSLGDLPDPGNKPNSYVSYIDRWVLYH